MNFSPKQQQVLWAAFLIYGVWLLAGVAAQTQHTPRVTPIAQPDPPELLVYIDPPVDLNAADVAELQLLPGIGPVMAARIVAFRQQHGVIRALAELDAVPGIGPKTLQRLAPYFNPPE